jgi:3-oxoacyl-(acyl-carrier-protein) synthase
VPGRFAPELPLPALTGARRFSPWLKMSLAAAQEALALGSQLDLDRLGVIGGTGYGSLTHTAAFVENLILNREAQPQPANFIYSVHNAASTQVAQALGAHGYNLTITHDHTSYEQALLAAARRLPAGDEERILVLGADEYHPCAQAVQKRFGLWRRRQGVGFIPGEGAAAMLVGPVVPGAPAVAEVALAPASALGSAEEERELLAQALMRVGLGWEDVVLVLAGFQPGARFVSEVFSTWRSSTGRAITPYLEMTGFFPTAAATALALGAATLGQAGDGTGFWYPGFKKNQHRNAVLLYNRSQVENRSWVILTI